MSAELGTFFLMHLPPYTISPVPSHPHHLIPALIPAISHLPWHLTCTICPMPSLTSPALVLSLVLTHAATHRLQWSSIMAGHVLEHVGMCAYIT